MGIRTMKTVALLAFALLVVTADAGHGKDHQALERAEAKAEANAHRGVKDLEKTDTAMSKVEDAANTVAKHVSAFGHAEAQLMESSKGSQNDSKRLEKLANKMDEDAQDNAKTAQKETKHTRVRSMATKDMQEQKTALAETNIAADVETQVAEDLKKHSGWKHPNAAVRHGVPSYMKRDASKLEQMHSEMKAIAEDEAAMAEKGENLVHELSDN